ncbi:hypothetical protein D3C74_194010 [compost metagenome]
MIQDRKCRECSVVFQGGPRAYYCPSCRIERKKTAKQAYVERKRRGESRSLGSSDKCERCGKTYVVEASLQRFCPDCQPIHALEYDRDTALPFYHVNKDRINPPRKLKRRKRSNKCEWCGNEFEPVNGSTTCNDECFRLNKNRYQREWGKQLRQEGATPEGAYTLPKIADVLGVHRTTMLNRYKAGKLPTPDGFEKRGNPYWLEDNLPDILKTPKKPPTD